MCKAHNRCRKSLFPSTFACHTTSICFPRIGPYSGIQQTDAVCVVRIKGLEYRVIVMTSSLFAIRVTACTHMNVAVNLWFCVTELIANKRRRLQAKLCGVIRRANSINPSIKRCSWLSTTQIAVFADNWAKNRPSISSISELCLLLQTLYATFSYLTVNNVRSFVFYPLHFFFRNF